MAITGIDGLIGGAQPMQHFVKITAGTSVVGRHKSLWRVDGIPVLGGYDTTLNGVALTAPVVGSFPFTDPASGFTYLTRFAAAVNGSTTGSLYLCDRLWHNGGITITSTSSQSITSPTWPARDNNGTTNGDGVLLAVEVSSQTGAGTPTITVGYTSSDGTAGRSATNQVATAATSTIYSMYTIGLQGNDNGVRSVQSIQLSATWTSGTINLVAYRIIAQLDIGATTYPYELDALSIGLPRIYDDSVMYLALLPNTTTALTASGVLQWAQG